jgi:outer membrane protein assembly factor BamA
MLKQFTRAFLTLSFALVCVTGAYSQQADIPPAAPVDAETAIPGDLADSAEPTRIVGGRPNLYWMKKNLHPISWIEALARPPAKLAERGANRFTSQQKSTRVRGVKFSINGTGSSSGAGPEIKPFHNDLFGTGLQLELPLVITYRLYESYRFRLTYPLVRGEETPRLGLELSGRYNSRPSETFYGIGNDISDLNKTKFRSVARTAGIALNARIGKAWTLRLEEGYRSIGITEPRNYISSKDVFADSGIPGMSDAGGTGLISTVSLERNTKDRNYLASSGGRQYVEASLHEGLSGGDFSYWRYRAGIQQFFPLDEDHRKVIAFRTDVETNREKGGSVIPFFDLPIVGSHSTVRGIPSRRYTDKSSMTASLEYRYRIWRHFDWGLFVDTGQVGSQIGDFSFSKDRLHTGYGMRFMVRAGNKHAMSIDLAHSREGWAIYADFSPDF